MPFSSCLTKWLDAATGNRAVIRPRCIDECSISCVFVKNTRGVSNEFNKRWKEAELKGNEEPGKDRNKRPK